MSTSLKTRKYWLDQIMIGWAEERLTDQLIDPGGDTPQLAEFRAVVADVLADSEQNAALRQQVEQLTAERDALRNLETRVKNAFAQIDMPIHETSLGAAVEELVLRWLAGQDENNDLRAEIETFRDTLADNEAYGVTLIHERDALQARAEAAEARIEALEAVQRWIPVEDGLPEEEGHYIVAVSESTSRSPIDWRDRVVYECVYSGVGWHTANDVTHWLPLPQPPGGEG